MATINKASAQFELLVHYMSSCGLRITKQRKQTLRIFLQSAQGLTAIQVYQQLRLVFSTISYETVYRNIKQFRHLGIIKAVVHEGTMVFQLKSNPFLNAEQRAVCMVCTNSIPLDPEIIPSDVQLPLHFQPSRYEFTVYGYCTTCTPVDKGVDY